MLSEVNVCGSLDSGSEVSMGGPVGPALANIGLSEPMARPRLQTEVMEVDSVSTAPGPSTSSLDDPAATTASAPDPATASTPDPATASKLTVKLKYYKDCLTKLKHSEPLATIPKQMHFFLKVVR